MGEVVMFPKRELPLVNGQCQAFLAGGRIDGNEFRNLSLINKATSRKFEITTRTNGYHDLMVSGGTGDKFQALCLCFDDAALKEIIEHGQRYFALKAERFMERGYEEQATQV